MQLGNVPQIDSEKSNESFDLNPLVDGTIYLLLLPSNFTIANKSIVQSMVVSFPSEPTGACCALEQESRSLSSQFLFRH